MIRNFIRLKCNILTVSVLTILISIGGLTLSLAFNIYMTRNKMCKPEELLSILKDRLGIDFIKYNISNIKSAKSIFYLGHNHDTATFLLKFTTEPNFIEKLVNSIPEEKRDEMLILESYSLEIDYRSKGRLYPKWFKEPIEKGEKLLYQSYNGKMRAYIDTTDAKQFVVYIEGNYYRPKD